MQQKQLPPNPSLEHLKSQAKQLLKAHNEGSLDAFRRIRSFFPKLADATDVEIQNAAFGLQDAQLAVAREYGFASWTQLKAEVLRQEQSAEKTLPKDLLFQILRTPDLTQAHIQRVEDLLTADPALVSVRDEDGRTPIEALASRGLINFGKDRWYRPIRHLYDLFREHGAATHIVAAVLMDDREHVETSIRNNPEILKQRFNRLRTWRGISLLAIAAGCNRIEIAKILIEADPSLVTEGQAEGKGPMDLLVKPWHHSAFEAEPRKPFYDLLVENGAVPDVGAALAMDDLLRAGAYVARNPQLLEQQFVCGNQIKFRPIEIAAAYGREFILSLLFTVAAAHEIDIEKDLASALTQTFALDVTEKLLETTQPAASVITNALVFACEVYQPEKVQLLLKYGADPSASLKAKFRYDVVQNLKLGDDGSWTSEMSPLFLPGTKTLTSETVSHTYEMSPLLVAIGTWYGVREAAAALDECLEIVEALLEAGADVHRSYRVDIDGEVLELTPLTYTQELASMFPDKPFDRILEVLGSADVGVG
jgi:ankyrin repeat protein